MNNTPNYGIPFKLCNFLRKRHIKNNGTRVAPNAYEPRKNNIIDDGNYGRLEVSNFEIQGLDKIEVCSIAKDNNIKPNNKLPHGYCTILEGSLDFREIEIDFDDVPKRHCNLIGWEINDKLKNQLIATELAETASNNLIIFD